MKKVQWIIQYYGIAIVVTVISLCVVITVIKSIFGPGEVYAARVMIYDNGCSSDMGQFFQEELTAQFGEPCEVVTYRPDDPVQNQAFIVRLNAELDILLAPEAEMQELWKNGYFTEMEKIEPDAYYYQVMKEYSGYQTEDIYIGIAVNGKNKDVQSLVKQYFSRK